LRKMLVFILWELLLLSVFPQTIWGESSNSGLVVLGKYRIVYDEVFEDDTDGDGINDRTSYYKQGTLVLTAWDTDRDGKDDLWFRFDSEEYLDLEVSDLNGDGRPDEFVHINRNEIITKVEKVKGPRSSDIDVLNLSQANESWVREWTILNTVKNFPGGGEAGFYPEAVRSGHANPNRGRKGILYLHPKSQQEPIRIKRNVMLTGSKPTLKMGVSGNRDVDGDWILLIKVNGKPLEKEKIINGAQGWQDLTFDLSAFSGQTVSIVIEARANNWFYEYVFFDYIRIEEEISSEKIFVSDKGHIILTIENAKLKTIENGKIAWILTLSIKADIDLTLTANEFQIEYPDCPKENIYISGSPSGIFYEYPNDPDRSFYRELSESREIRYYAGEKVSRSFTLPICMKTYEELGSTQVNLVMAIEYFLTSDGTVDTLTWNFSSLSS